jgi:hypothetical protein
MNPFDYVNSINSPKKENLMVDEVAEKAYNPWLVNKALSYFKDTVLYANEINMHSHLSNMMQYDYYLHAIKPGKRYSKWIKTDKNDNLDLICKVYGCNKRIGAVYLKVISKEDLKKLKEMYKFE